MIYYIGNKLKLINEEIQECTLEDAYEYLKDKKEVGIDIETTRKYNKYENEGLDPYTSNIVMFQIGDLENQYIIDYRDFSSLGNINKILINPNIIKVGHNLKFEYKHIFVNENIRLVNVYDTMIAEQISYNGYFKKYGLADLIEFYFNVKVDKSTRLGFLTIGSRPFYEKEIMYGVDDIIYPLKIKKEQEKRINKFNLKACIRLEMLFLLVLGDIELKGINFNKNKWLKTYQNNLDKLSLIEERLNSFVIINYETSKFVKKQLDLFDDDLKCNINWGSSKQVIEFLLFINSTYCPKEISKTTGKNSYTVNSNILKNHIKTLKLNRFEIEFFNNYLKFKELEQSCSTFGKDFFKYINPITNRIHSDYKQILNTGRISSRNPNLQNIPSDDEFRYAFDAPKGFKIINADYSGQEQIILANKSMDRNLLDFYDEGLGDMHSFVASCIFKKPFNSYIEAKKHEGKFGMHHAARLKERQTAKAAGFAINYGGNGYTISKNLNISVEEGEKVYEEYFNSFPGLKSYFKIIQDTTLQRGYIIIDSITKRKYFFKSPKSNKEINSIKRMALNFPIQGEAGSITKLAAIFFRQELVKSRLDDKIFITNLVHDEINVEAQEPYAETAATLLENSMKRAGDLWCKRVPLNADAKIVDYWTH